MTKIVQSLSHEAVRITLPFIIVCPVCVVIGWMNVIG